MVENTSWRLVSGNIGDRKRPARVECMVEWLHAAERVDVQTEMYKENPASRTSTRVPTRNSQKWKPPETLHT